MGSDMTEEVCTMTEEEVCTTTTVEDTECRTMMVEECRWMKVKVCDPPPSSYLPPAPRRHGQERRGKPDPIGDLIRDVGEGVAKIVGDLEKSLQKLVDPKAGQQSCRWEEKEWCGPMEKEWCEPTTRQVPSCSLVPKMMCSPVTT